MMTCASRLVRLSSRGYIKFVLSALVVSQFGCLDSRVARCRGLPLARLRWNQATRRASGIVLPCSLQRAPLCPRTAQHQYSFPVETGQRTPPCVAIHSSRADNNGPGAV